MVKLLPHEQEWLRSKLLEGAQANQQASDDLSNAVENGNVWHDNAEYDEVIERMKHIDSIYKPIAVMLGDAEVVDYPDLDGASVALGSLVAIRDSYNAFTGLIVGQASVGRETYERIWSEDDHDDEIEVIGSEAPLGQALTGKSIGETTEWEVGGRTMTAEVVGVDNTWLQQRLGRLTLVA